MVVICLMPWTTRLTGVTMALRVNQAEMRPVSRLARPAPASTRRDFSKASWADSFSLLSRVFSRSMIWASSLSQERRALRTGPTLA